MIHLLDATLEPWQQEGLLNSTGIRDTNIDVDIETVIVSEIPSLKLNVETSAIDKSKHYPLRITKVIYDIKSLT